MGRSQRSDYYQPIKIKIEASNQKLVHANYRTDLVPESKAEAVKYQSLKARDFDMT